MVKKLSPYILLLIFCVLTFHFLLFSSYISSQKSTFREQTLNGKHNIVEIKFSYDDIFKNKNGFEWKENNKEVIINGLYHEVVSVENFKDHIIVCVMEDSEENERFEKFFCSNNGFYKNCGELIKLLLGFTYLENIEDFTFVTQIFKKEVKLENFQFIDFKYFLEQIKPPRF